MKLIDMMGSTTGQYEVISQPVNAGSWYGFSNCLHTISISVQNFTGRLILEGSIAMDPQDGDWFPVELDGKQCLDFPFTYSPTGQNGGDTGTFGYTFAANLLWLRVRLEREHLHLPHDTEEEIGRMGGVRKISLGF